MQHTVEGKLFVDGWGRMYFDTCPDSATHILRPTPEGQERPPRCRIYVEDLLQDLIGKSGVFSIEATQIGGTDRIAIALPVPEEELMTELNKTSHFLGSRLSEQENLFDREKMNTAQVIALGALFFKHLLEMAPNNRNLYLAIAQLIGGELKEA